MKLATSICFVYGSLQAFSSRSCISMMNITMQHASMIIARCAAIEELSPVEASLLPEILLSLFEADVPSSEGVTEVLTVAVS
jgi:hypothetical protein